MEISSYPDVLTVAQLGKYLNIGTSKAYQLCHTSTFPVVRLGKKMLIPRKQLDAWLEQQINNSH